MKHYDIAIIGGGASGCYLAALLSDTERKTALIESCDRLGRKLSATGNGQGNLSNILMSADKYFSSAPELVADVLCDQSVLDPFLGIFEADEKGRVYPTGRRASSLTDSLRRKIERAENIDVYLGAEVTSLAHGFVLTFNGEQISADKVVLAAGGKAQKQFGTDGKAYALAERFGHKTTKLYPSLVQLKTDTENIKTLKGLRVDCLATAIYEGKPLRSCRGDVIFTDYGVSGNAIFTLSSYVTDKIGAEINLSFLPDVGEREIASDVERKQNAGYERSEWLACTLPNQLGRAIMRRCKSDKPEDIARTVKNFRLSCKGTLGFDYAQVTRGGIEMSGVSYNLESEYERGLYFCGEILDVDGECGGYNLHWAFSSAKRVFDAIYLRR